MNGAIATDLGKTLHVEQRGTGSDAVLVHGWGLHGGIWSGWQELPQLGLCAHAVDLPGHGRSRWHDAYERWEDWIDALARSTPARADYIGWSFGAQLCLALAQRAPERVRRLVLIAASPHFARAADWPWGLEASVLDEFARDLADDYERTLWRFLTLQCPDTDRDSLRRLRQQWSGIGLPDRRALVRALEFLKSNDLRSVLAAVRCPVLLISGGRDVLVPAGAVEALERALPDARRAHLEQAGHAPFLSHGTELARAVEGFLHG